MHVWCHEQYNINRSVEIWWKLDIQQGSHESMRFRNISWYVSMNMQLLCTGGDVLVLHSMYIYVLCSRPLFFFLITWMSILCFGQETNEWTCFHICFCFKFCIAFPMLKLYVYIYIFVITWKAMFCFLFWRRGWYLDDSYIGICFKFCITLSEINIFTPQFPVQNELLRIVRQWNCQLTIFHIHMIVLQNV